MPIVKKAKIPAQTQHKYEMFVKLGDRDGGKPEYTFKLHGNHIEVFLSEQPRPAGPEWYDDLSDQEKLQVFQVILAEYRQRSMGAGGMKVAALGITEQGRIFISENSEQLSDQYNRQCAEQTMVTVSANRESYNQALEQKGEDTPTAKYATYKAVYLMGGRDNMDPPIICPCGNCTDLLAKVMAPEAPVWMLPVSAPMDVLNEPLAINTAAKNTGDVKPGEAWQTTIGYLNYNRSVKLKPEDVDLQKEALRTLATEMSIMIKTERSARKMNGHRASAIFEKELGYLKKMAEKEMDPVRVNNLQVLQVKMTLFDQVQALIDKYDVSDFSPENIEKLIVEHVDAVRCVAIKLDNGKVFVSTHTKSSLNKALPPRK